jgi:hypothetical protein
MNVRTLYTAMILCVLFAVSPMFAQETFDFEFGKVSLTVPAKWSHEIDGNHLMIASPDQKVLLNFEVITVEELEGRTEQMGTELAEAFPDIEIGEVEESKVNGMDLISIGGVCDGGKKYAGYDLIVTKNAQVLVVTGIIDFSMKDKYSKDIMSLYKSIKPMK